MGVPGAYCRTASLPGDRGVSLLPIRPLPAGNEAQRDDLPRLCCGGGVGCGTLGAGDGSPPGTPEAACRISAFTGSSVAEKGYQAVEKVVVRVICAPEPGLKHPNQTKTLQNWGFEPRSGAQKTAPGSFSTR